MEAFPRDPLGPELARAEKVPLAAHRWPRDALDWYVEPVEVTEALLGAERFVGRTWDPCCGSGNIPGALIAAGAEAVGTDIVNRGADRIRHGWQGTLDFLADDFWLPGAVNVVFNPPFRAGRLEACLRKALRHATGKVAAFVPARFMWGAERTATFYAEHPEQRQYLLVNRPSCPPGHVLESGAAPGNGQSDWAWLVWDRTTKPISPPVAIRLHSRQRGTPVGFRPAAAARADATPDVGADALPGTGASDGADEVTA